MQTKIDRFISGGLVILVAGTMSVHAANIPVTPGPDTIHAAVSSAVANDALELAPGLYAITNTIIIDKPLSILGPQAGVDPRPSSGTTRVAGDTTSEAIIDGGGVLGNLLRVAADNVVIDGVEVRNGTADMLESRPSAPISGTVVQFCIIHDALGDEGIQLRNTINAQVSINHVFATAGDGINVCCGSTGQVIFCNEVHDIFSPDAGIYVYQSTTAVDIDATIEGNLIYNIYDNDGIKLGHKRGDDAHLTGGTIANNVVHDTIQDGITVYTSRTLVDGNEVFNSLSENGAIFVEFDVSDVTIVNNNVHDNGPSAHPILPGDCTPCLPGIIHGLTFGIRVGKCRPYAFNNLIIANNCITGNVDGGAVFGTSLPNRVLNARENWWGDPLGPTHPSNPGATGDSVTDCVDFTSPLTESCPSSPTTNVCVLNIVVDIDIKPGSDPNSINLGSQGSVPVAIFSTDTFDATTVNPLTVTLAGASVRLKGKGTPMASEQDVNGDGLLDLVVHVSTLALELTPGDTVAILEAETFDGTPIIGTDSVRIVQ